MFGLPPPPHHPRDDNDVPGTPKSPGTPTSQASCSFFQSSSSFRPRAESHTLKTELAELKRKVAELEELKRKNEELEEHEERRAQLCASAKRSREKHKVYVAGLEKDRERLHQAEREAKRLHSLVEGSAGSTPAAAAAVTPIEVPNPDLQFVTPATQFVEVPPRVEFEEEGGTPYSEPPVRPSRGPKLTQEEKEAKNEERLISNRMSAKASRERKKIYVAKLEESIEEYRNELAAIKDLGERLQSQLRQKQAEIQGLILQLQFANERLGLGLLPNYEVVANTPLEEEAGIASPRWR